MNLSPFLEKLKTKQYRLTARQRLMMVVTIGIVAILITVYCTASQETVQLTPPSNNSQGSATTPNQPVILMENQVPQVRDPFSLPPDIKEQKNKSDPVLPNYSKDRPSMVPEKISVSKPQESFKLTGIASNGDQCLAVIMSANKSKAYKVNDFVGTYQLTDIRQDSIILKNANGTLVLQLEQTGQKGGNHSGK